MNLIEQMHWTATIFKMRIGRKSHNENRVLSSDETRKIIRDTQDEMAILYRKDKS